MVFTETAISTWLAGFLWPLMRISAVFMAAPIFASRQVPARWRAALALVITWIVMPILPPVPVVETFSHEAAMITLQQALVFGGQVMAYSMGLGFASMMDPQNGVQVPVVSQYYLILATLLFLVLNGHLILIELVIDSFTTLPIAADGLTRNTFWEIVSWGGHIFSAGLMMSLPVVTALLLVNLGMGVVARAAPQLNIFAVGFPMAMLIGFILMWVTLPDVLHYFSGLVDKGFQMVISTLGIVR